MQISMFTVRGFLSMMFFISLSFGAVAQVLVHKEPKHRLAFANEQIRILDVVMAPGDSSIYHIHHTPSLFILLTSTETGSMEMGEEPSSGMNTAGTLFYENLSAPHTRTHRVWNMDKDTFQVLDIELISKDSVFKQTPLSSPQLQKEIDTAYVRAYTLSLGRDQSFSLKEKHRSFILVSFDRAVVQTGSGPQSLARGGFLEIRKGQQFSLQNKGGQSARFALIEMPGGN